MYGPNGPPHHGFARISRWQLEKVGYPNVIERFMDLISLFLSTKRDERGQNCGLKQGQEQIEGTNTTTKKIMTMISL